MNTVSKADIEFRRTRCASAVAAVLSMLAAGAAAQDSKPAAAADPNVSVVVVSGTRASVASAIDRKKGAGTVSDSIVAEDIGQFPDKNVGEALSRVTGVQLSRDFGEGSQVAIRGVKPDLNRIEINGLSVLGTNGGSGRGAELRELASELIKSIDVYKGVTADMTEGGVGGTVSIKTNKPLDFKQRVIATTLSAERSSSRGGVQPRASLLAADKFFDGKLGLMANLVYDDVLTQNDYARNTSWRFLRDFDFSPEKTVVSRDAAVAAIGTPAGCASAAGLTAEQRTACQSQWYDYSPGISRYGLWTRDHKRSSGELTAQYKISNEANVWASYQANKQDQRLNDRNFGTDLPNTGRFSNTGAPPVYNSATGIPSTVGTCVGIPNTVVPAGMVVENHIVRQYTVGDCINAPNAGGQGAFATSARDFRLKIDSAYSSAGFNYRNGAFDAETMVARSKSNYVSESNNITLTQNAPGLVVKLDAQGLPHFTFPAASDPDKSNVYTQAQLQYRPSATKNTEDQLKLDFKYRLNLPVLTKVHFGTQYRKATNTKFEAGGFLASNGSDLTSTADDINVMTANVNQTLIFDPLYKGTVQRAPDPQTYINTAFSTKYINGPAMSALVDAVRGNSGRFFGGYDKVSGLPSSWMSPVYNQGTQFFDTSRFNLANLYSAPGSDGKTYAQIPTFGSDERIRSAYVRLDFDTELAGLDIEGNVGGRYSGTHDVSSGKFTYQQRVQNAPGSTAFTDRVLANSIVAIDNKYHDFLPSFNAATWIMPDKLVARVGWAKVMARPDVLDMAPNATCTAGSGNALFGGDGRDDCSAGNPTLKPFRATNKDISVEYYPSADSQLSLAWFRKDITTYILGKQLVKGVDLFKDGTLWDVNQIVNGGGVTTKGIELAGRTALTFLPGFLSGFGLDMNYTRMNFTYAKGSEVLNVLDGTLLPFAGMSKNSYNAGIWYDRDQFNARLAYNFRDRYYTGTNDVSGNPVFAQKTGFLDAKFQYRYSEKVSFAIEGKNLTNEVQITDGGDVARVNELAYSGRRYFASMSVKF